MPKGLNLEANQTNDKSMSFFKNRGFENIDQKVEATALLAANLIILF